MPDYKQLAKGLNTAIRAAEAEASALQKAQPAVNRLDMNFKDVTKRVPELTEAANRIKSGDMTPEQYAELVKRVKPVTPYDFVPQPASAEEAINALTSNKKAMFGKTSEIPAGEQADLRLDIPAYSQHGVWVNSIHRKDAPTVYGSVSAVKNATMIGAPDKALKVATGETAKAPFAVIRGEWNPMDEATAVKNAQKYLKHKDWRQVGYDPERHGYFYDRQTMAPVLGAEEVIQIGPLVLAKKPKFGDAKDFPFKRGGLTVMKYGKGGKADVGVALANAVAKASQEADAVLAAKAAERAAAGRKAADVARATAPMKMSEALGNMNVEGKGNLKVTQSDRTRVGGGNIGGAMFPGLQQVDPLYEGAVWGVGNKPTASGLINQSDENTLWSTILGSADQLKTNPLVFNKLRRGFTDAMKEGKLSDELATKINKNLALKFGEGADIRDPKIWRQADTFEKRALLADVMMGQGVAPGKGGIALGGEKSGKGVIFQPSEILKRETEPLLLHPEHGGDVPTFSVGPRLFTLSGEIKQRPDLHPGFPVILQGEDKGVVFKPAPGEIAMRDYAKRFKEKNKRSPGYYDWTLGEKGVGLPSQAITEEYLTYLQKAGFKKGGDVKRIHRIKAFDSDEAARKWKDEIAHEINKANGGAIKKMGWKATPAMKMAQGGAPNLGPADEHTMPDSSDAGRMNYEPGYAGGGWAKAGKAIAKAAQEAGLAKPVTAEKDLTTLQDFHTSLGDRVRAEAELARRMMEGFDYKYDKGQRVFTKDSAAKNRAPYEIIERTRVGNQVMREGDNPIGKVLRDEAGKAKRTPYEPGYRVRSQQGDDSSEFIIPASAILGDVEMALGGLARYDDGGTVDKAKLMAEILGRMAKEQGKEEIASLKKPRALTDLANRGIVASTVGAPVDIMNMGLEGIDFLRSKATGKPVENRLASDKPFLGSEHLKDLMTQYGMTTGEERPMMETGLSLVSPAGAVKGAAKTAEAAPKVGRAIEGGLNAATATVARPFTPATVTMEAVAPDLAKYKPRQWQETATRRLTGEGAPVSMETLGGQRTTKRPGQGVYENFEGQLETNPLVAVDVPRAGNLSTNKALRRDISQAGADLAQESVAAHRFLPMATNNIADASAMLIKPQGRSLTNEEVIKIGEQLPGMIVAHNPRLGGVVVMPYDYQKGKVPTEFFDAQDIAKSVLGKKANFTYGKADPVKDRLYIERGDYATEGAGTPSAASTAMRDRLKKAEARAFRAPAQSRSGLPAMRGVPATTAD